MIHRLSLLILAAALPVSAVEIPTFSPAEFNVRDFGARGNGMNNDSAFINGRYSRCQLFAHQYRPRRAGGGTKPVKWTLPEPRGHPHKAFAYAPAAALFVSDARGLRLQNVQFSYERADARPSLVAINVDGLEMERLHAQKTGTETLHLERVNKLLLHDSAPLPDQSVDQLNELAF